SSIMLARVAMPAVRQKRSKLAPTSCQASSTIAAGTTTADVVNSFMALLSFVDSAPRAYRLKASNACPPISTSTGTSPLSAKRYVYVWADGIYLQARLEDSKQCILVIIGATPEGKKELLGFTDGARESAQD